MDKIWLAKRYFSGSSNSNTQGKATTSTIFADALTDSTDGTVTIEVDNTELDVPCVGAVVAGQRVLVSLVSGSPVVIGASGWGDRVATIIQQQEVSNSHLYYDSSHGLILCLDSAYPDLGISAQIQSTGFRIRSDTTTIAEFTPTTISLEASDFLAGTTPVFAACTATGSASSVSLSADVITRVPLTSFSVKKGSSTSSGNYTDSRFEISSGGVRCCAAGYVLVSGSVYVEAVVDPDTGQSTNAAGCYVYKGNEEVTGTCFVPGVSTAIKSGAIVVEVAAGDVLTLRASASADTTATPSDANTYLSVVYV